MSDALAAEAGLPKAESHGAIPEPNPARGAAPDAAPVQGADSARPAPSAPASASGRRMRDFTTGNIWQHIVAFSWPMFVGNALQALYNTVDSFWVGRFVGPEALGAVSVSFPVMFALVALIMGLTMATTTMVAQYRGAREDEMVRRTVANSLI